MIHLAKNWDKTRVFTDISGKKIHSEVIEILTNPNRTFWKKIQGIVAIGNSCIIPSFALSESPNRNICEAINIISKLYNDIPLEAKSNLSTTTLKSYKTSIDIYLNKMKKEDRPMLMADFLNRNFRLKPINDPVTNDSIRGDLDDEAIKHIEWYFKKKYGDLEKDIKNNSNNRPKVLLILQINIIN